MPETKPTDKQKLRRSFACAVEGFFDSLRHERNLRIHCVAAVLALIACFVLRLPFWSWIAVLILIGMVISAELFNTALEALVDLASPELHPLAKRAKDASAAAVLFCAVIAVVAGCALYLKAFLVLVGVSL